MLIEQFYLFYIVASLILVIIARKFGSGYKGKHQRNINSSKRILSKLRKFNGRNINARVFTYIRKMDPFVFEELLLTCFEERGCRIRRGRRYTGDGGIDGTVWINGHQVILQAKRYTKHINSKDVAKFKALALATNSKALFVHSGITGPTARKYIDNSSIQIISGSTLINLLTCKPVNVFGVTI